MPGLVDDGRGSAPGAHRQDGPSRPWAWLAGVLVAALLAVGGVVWMIGSALGNDRPAPAAAPPASRSATPSPTSAPTPTPEETTSDPVPPPTTAVTTRRPAPTATRVVPLPPRPTTPRPTVNPALVAVPDVVGLRVDAARRVLEQAGLRATVLGIGDSDNRRVMAQQPSGGRVPRGTTVVLLAGRNRDR